MPLVGKSALTEGLLIAAGFAAGIAQECTVGKIMTDLVTKGEVSLPIDMSVYDPGRFIGKTFTWPKVWDISILCDYVAARNKGLEKEYQICLLYTSGCRFTGNRIF